MNDAEILRIAAGERSKAVSDWTSGLSKDQEKALSYYQGEPMKGDDDEDMAYKSRVVSRDVAEVVDWSVPELVKMFASRQKIAEFEPEKPEAEEAAAVAEVAVNHVFMNDNDGFERIHDQIKDGLLQKIGVVRVFWDEAADDKVEQLPGLSAEEAAAIASEENVEIIENNEGQDGTVELRIRRKGVGRCVIENIPPENFLIAAQADDEELVPYIGCRWRKSKSDLINDGFDRAKVSKIASEDSGNTTGDYQRHVKDGHGAWTEREAPEQEAVWLYDEYVKVDIDGDGVSELIRVQSAGDVVLDWEEVAEQPFSVFSPNRMPHRVIGRSMADDVIDLQEIKTAIWREGLDNMAWANSPQTELPDQAINENTISDLMDNRPGGIVRTKAPGMINTLARPDVSGSALGMIEHVNGVKEERTGVSRYNQGLDADSLNHTATGITRIMEAGTARRDLIARLYANCLRKTLFKVLRCLSRNQTEVRQILHKGEWVQMAPTTWGTDFNVKVRVGLGSASKDSLLEGITQIMMIQKEMLAGGLGMVTPENMMTALSKAVDALEVGSVEEFFTMPPEQQEGPSPEEQRSAADAQMKQAELQLKAQEGQIKVQIAEHETQAKIMLERERMAMEAQLKREEMTIQRDLKMAEIAATGKTNENIRSPV